jgi:hypothetical protein
MFTVLYEVSIHLLTYSFFDYGNFKIFGSSPEAQIIIKIESRNSSHCRNVVKNVETTETMPF